LQIAKNLAFGEKGAVVVVQDVKPIWGDWGNVLSLVVVFVGHGQETTQNWPRRSTMICLESEAVSILHPWSVGIRAVPNSLLYWSMSRDVPRTVSGSSIPVRRSWIKPSEEIMSEAALGS